MTHEKSSTVKSGVLPPQPKTKLVIFSILMAGILVSLWALYKIARPFVENHNSLDIALIAGIILTIISYIMAVKGGVQPSPPKTILDINDGVNPPSEPELKASAAIKSGIDPAERKSKPTAIKGGIGPAERKGGG